MVISSYISQSSSASSASYISLLSNHIITNLVLIVIIVISLHTLSSSSSPSSSSLLLSSASSSSSSLLLLLSASSRHHIEYFELFSYSLFLSHTTQVVQSNIRPTIVPAICLSLHLNSSALGPDRKQNILSPSANFSNSDFLPLLLQLLGHLPLMRQPVYDEVIK